MAIKQVSVFIENKKGKLSDAVKIIAEADINIRAMSIGDADEFGILRLIVSDTEKAKELLSESTVVKVIDVIAVRMEDKKGALYTILKVLEEAQINVEYTYAFAVPGAGDHVVFRVDNVEEAEKVFAEHGIKTLSMEEMKNL